MKRFTDRNGLGWEIVLTVASVRRVRDLAGVDLYRVAEQELKPYADLVGDIVKLTDVVYAACKPQADARGLSDVQFGESLSGDCIIRMRDAFTEELIDFFPDPLTRKTLRAVITNAREIERQNREAAEVIIDAMMRKSSTGSPVTSAWTQVRSRFGRFGGWWKARKRCSGTTPRASAKPSTTPPT